MERKGNKSEVFNGSLDYDYEKEFRKDHLHGEFVMVLVLAFSVRLIEIIIERKLSVVFEKIKSSFQIQEKAVSRLFWAVEQYKPVEIVRLSGRKIEKSDNFKRLSESLLQKERGKLEGCEPFYYEYEKEFRN